MSSTIRERAMKRKFANKILTSIVSCALALATIPGGLQATAYQDPGAPAQGAPPAPDQPQPAHLTPEQLQELVAPIALYPDALLAQILAASAYPTQIVEADRMAQDNPGLKGRELAEEADRQDWDPSVKSLVEFPTVLANLERNLSWTSELGAA